MSYSAKGVLEEIEEGIVAETRARKINRTTGDRHLAFEQAALDERLERTGDDPTVDQLHDSETLGGRNEARWRNQHAGLVAHPDEDLEVDTSVSAIGESDDLLLVEAESIVGESLLNTLDPVHLADAIEHFLVLVAMRMDAVAAFLLGHEAGHVGLRHHVLRSDEPELVVNEADTGG